MSIKTNEVVVKNWEEKDYQLVEVQDWYELNNNERVHLGGEVCGRSTKATL